MKHFYLSLLLLFSFNLYAQDELLGQWYLHYIEVDGVQQYSTIPNSASNYYTIKTIIFNNDDSFDGQVCNNGYGGNYSVIDETTLSITNLNAFAGYCDYLSESQLFLSPYLWTVLSDANGVASDIFNFSITGSNDDETLTLTNSESNKAIYGRSPLPESRLPGTWYLHSVTKNGVEEINTFNPNFEMNFTLTPGSFSSIDYDGTAVCNDYFGEYHLEGIENIRIIGFSFTLVLCDQVGASLEESYFSFFSEAQMGTMDLNYTISGPEDDETLIITRSNGDYVTFGRQTLSVSDIPLNAFSIGLKENPAASKLALDINESMDGILSYQVFSIDGKQILNGTFDESYAKDISNLNSGMYFLTLTLENRSSQTLKFIKE